MKIMHQLSAWHPYSVHGLINFVTLHKLSLKKTVMCLWASFCFGFCVWEASGTIRTFMEFNGKTATEFVEADRDGLRFPAISFCSTSIGLRSALGGSKNLTSLIMAVFTRTVNPLKIDQLASMCYDPTINTTIPSKSLDWLFFSSVITYYNNVSV